MVIALAVDFDRKTRVTRLGAVDNVHLVIVSYDSERRRYVARLVHKETGEELREYSNVNRNFCIAWGVDFLTGYKRRKRSRARY